MRRRGGGSVRAPRTWRASSATARDTWTACTATAATCSSTTMTAPATAQPTMTPRLTATRTPLPTATRTASPRDVRVHAPEPRRRRDYDDPGVVRRPHRGRRAHDGPRKIGRCEGYYCPRTRLQARHQRSGTDSFTPSTAPSTGARVRAVACRWQTSSARAAHQITATVPAPLTHRRPLSLPTAPGSRGR